MKVQLFFLNRLFAVVLMTMILTWGSPLGVFKTAHAGDAVQPVPSPFDRLTNMAKKKKNGDGSMPGFEGINRQRAEALFNKAMEYQQQENYAEAIRFYQQAATADAKYAEAYSHLGYCYRKQGQHQKAVAAYQKAVDIKPELAQAHGFLGEAYAEKGQFEMAMTHLKILKTLDPEEAKTLEAFIDKMMAVKKE